MLLLQPPPIRDNLGPGVFSKVISEILLDLKGVVCMVDDDLVHGRTQEEHDQHLELP